MSDEASECVINMLNARKYKKKELMDYCKINKIKQGRTICMTVYRYVVNMNTLKLNIFFKNVGREPNNYELRLLNIDVDDYFLTYAEY